MSALFDREVDDTQIRINGSKDVLERAVLASRSARTTYIGRHRFNTQFSKTRERKPDADVVEMAVPAIIDPAEFEAVQTLLRTRSPAQTAPRVVSGPTLLTGICFCAAACSMAMTLRTGKGGRYRYYACC